MVALERNQVSGRGRGRRGRGQVAASRSTRLDSTHYDKIASGSVGQELVSVFALTCEHGDETEMTRRDKVVRFRSVLWLMFLRKEKRMTKMRAHNTSHGDDKRRGRQ